MFYKKGINKNSAKQMFNFLKNHFQYHTMSSWNGLKSAANNVKLYNLNLEGDWNVAYYILNINEGQNEATRMLNGMIHEWEVKHPNYEVGFNGQNDGYLVLYNKKNNHNVIPEAVADSETYEEYKQNIKETYPYLNIEDVIPELKEATTIVQSFDKLCDKMRKYVNELSLKKVYEPKSYGE